jgi:hypothetical protein
MIPDLSKALDSYLLSIKAINTSDITSWCIVQTVAGMACPALQPQPCHSLQWLVRMVLLRVTSLPIGLPMRQSVKHLSSYLLPARHQVHCLLGQVEAAKAGSRPGRMQCVPFARISILLRGYTGANFCNHNLENFLIKTQRFHIRMPKRASRTISTESHAERFSSRHRDNGS